jgi:hypothetical protein
LTIAGDPASGQASPERVVPLIPDDWLSRALRAMPFFQGLSPTMQARVYQTIAEEYRAASPEKRAKMKVQLGVADG